MKLIKQISKDILKLSVINLHLSDLSQINMDFTNDKEAKYRASFTLKKYKYMQTLQ